VGRGIAFTPLADLCPAGRISIHVDRPFGLDDVAEAVAHVGEGQALGKVVVENRSALPGVDRELDHGADRELPRLPVR